MVPLLGERGAFGVEEADLEEELRRWCVVLHEVVVPAAEAECWELWWCGRRLAGWVVAREPGGVGVCRVEVGWRSTVQH